jgi:hypothetical protein
MLGLYEDIFLAIIEVVTNTFITKRISEEQKYYYIFLEQI